MDTSPGYVLVNDGKKNQSTPIDLSYYKTSVQETTPEDDNRKTDQLSSTAPRLHKVNGANKVNSCLQEKSQKLSKRKLFPAQLTINNGDFEKKRKLDMKLKNNDLQSPIKPTLTERQQLVLLLGTTNNHGDLPQSSGPSFTKIKSKKGKMNHHIYRRNKRGETPLHIAAIKNDVNTIKKLIKEGIDVQVKDYAGWTALHEACNHGNLSSVKLLLERKAEVNEPGFEGDTPLHDAVVNNHAEIVEMLLDFGADSNRSNTRGATPIDLIHSEDMNQVFLARGLRTSFTLVNENKVGSKVQKIPGVSQNDSSTVEVTMNTQRNNERSSKVICSKNETMKDKLLVQKNIENSDRSGEDSTPSNTGNESLKTKLKTDILSPKAETVSRLLDSKVSQEPNKVQGNMSDNHQVLSGKELRTGVIIKQVIVKEHMCENNHCEKQSPIKKPIKMSQKENPNEMSQKQSPNEITQKQSPNEISLKQSPNEISLKQSPINMSQKENQNEITLKQSTDEISLKQSPINMSQKENQNEITLKQSTDEISLEQSPSKISQKIKNPEKPVPIRISEGEDPMKMVDKQCSIKKLLITKERSDHYNRTGSILCNEIQRKETQGESKMEKPVMYICKLTPGGHCNEEFTVETTTINPKEEQKESPINMPPLQTSIGTLHQSYGGFKDTIAGTFINNPPSIVSSTLQKTTSSGLDGKTTACGDSSLQKQQLQDIQTSTVVIKHGLENDKILMENDRKLNEQKNISSTLASKKYNTTNSSVIANENAGLTVIDTPTNTCQAEDGHPTTTTLTGGAILPINTELSDTVKTTLKNDNLVVKSVNKNTTRLTTKPSSHRSSVVTDRVTTRHQNNHRNTMSGLKSDRATLRPRKPTTTWKSLFSKNKRNLSEIKIPFYDEFLMNTKNYDLASNEETINPLTQVIGNSFKEMLILRQEKSKVDLIKKQKSELDKLQICMEQEIIRLNSRKASLTQENKTPPGVCDILRWQNMTSQQLNIEKKKLYQKRFSAECNKTLTTNSETIAEKYNKLKTLMTMRHTHEVQALDAVAKRELESLC